VGPTGARTQLAGGPTVTGTLTSGTSTFTSNGMNFTLVQTVAPLFDTSSVRTGSVLTQTYTITNPTAATINFELVRYNVTDMLGILPQIGGRLPGPPETVYERESVVAPAVSRIVVGLTGVGGTIPATNRFEVSQYSTLRSLVLAGTALSDTVVGDGNANGESDSAYDVGEAVRNTFSLAPGATDVYTTHTFFGTGDPATMFNPGTPPPPPPPPPGPAGAGPEGSHTGSSGTGGSNGATEGSFGMGARSASRRPSLLGPFTLQTSGGSTFVKLVSGGNNNLASPGVDLTVFNVTHRQAQTDPQQAMTNEEGPSGWLMLLATLLGVMVLLAVIKVVPPLLA
jgi:hypothetical protein